MLRKSTLYLSEEIPWELSRGLAGWVVDTLEFEVRVPILPDVFSTQTNNYAVLFYLFANKSIALSICIKKSLSSYKEEMEVPPPASLEHSQAVFQWT